MKHRHIYEEAVKVFDEKKQLQLMLKKSRKFCKTISKVKDLSKTTDVKTRRFIEGVAEMHVMMEQIKLIVSKDVYDAMKEIKLIELDDKVKKAKK